MPLFATAEVASLMPGRPNPIAIDRGMAHCWCYWNACCTHSAPLPLRRSLEMLGETLTLHVTIGAPTRIARMSHHATTCDVVLYLLPVVADLDQNSGGVWLWTFYSSLSTSRCCSGSLLSWYMRYRSSGPCGSDTPASGNAPQHHGARPRERSGLAASPGQSFCAIQFSCSPHAMSGR